jgi:small redox-active disulfide protein 2
MSTVAGVGATRTHEPSRPGGVIFAVTGVAAAVVVYTQLRSIADFITHGVFRLAAPGRFSAAVEFFVFEVPKVLLLLTGVVFVIGVLRTWFTPERARRLLAGRREASGNVLASLFGVATPFCSCSAVPLFIGFVTAGVIMMKIEILGPGCTRCKETFRIVRHVVEQAGLDAEVIKDESIERMMALGLMATPGLAVDGKIVLSGRIPRAEEVRHLLGVA